MKRRAFCGMTVLAGAAASLPGGRLLLAQGKSAQTEAADLRAVKLSGAETTLERAAVKDFRASLKGPLFSLGQEGYDGARRVWNGMIDKHPALIAHCAAPFTDGYYVNLNDVDPKSTDRNYGANFARLAAVKTRFDPLNLFRLNANIKPA